MRIMISYQVDSVEEARAVMDAVESRGKLTTFRVQDEPEQVLTLDKAIAKLPGQNMLNTIHPALDAKSLAAKAMLDNVTLARKNVSPGTPAIGKIGSKAKDEIIGMLTLKPATMPGKWSEHLKLLWSRGEVKFDGTSFYL